MVGAEKETMCIFCAAIPAVAAAGTAAHGQQREAAREAERQGQPSVKPKVPAGRAATVLIVALAVAVMVYHAHLAG